MSATPQAFSRSISTNSSGKKKRLPHIFQRRGSPTWRKQRPNSEYHRKATVNGAAAESDQTRFSTRLSTMPGAVRTQVEQAPVGEEPETWRLHHYRSREVAEELCLMDGEILRKIDPSELHNGAWMKKEKDQLAPNVLSMVRASNELALMVPSEILEETTTHGRAKVISSFIKIASKLHRLRNYNSLKAVLAGLQCTPIFRLKKTWKEVSAKRRKKFEKLSDLMSEEYNWKLYRTELETCFANNIPCIPFLGVLLTTIVQQESTTLSRSGQMSRHGRKRISGVEMYTILEAITVRNRLEKLRKQSSVWRLSSVPSTTVVKRPAFVRSQSHFSKSSLVSGKGSVADMDITSTNPMLRLDDINQSAGTTRALLVGDSSGSDEDEERLLVESVKELDLIGAESGSGSTAGMGMENQNDLTILEQIELEVGTSSSDSETTSPILLPRCRLHAVDSIYSDKGSRKSKKLSLDTILQENSKTSADSATEPDDHEILSSLKKSVSESMVLDEIMNRADPSSASDLPKLFQKSDLEEVNSCSSTRDDPVPARSSRSGSKVNWSDHVTDVSTSNVNDSNFLRVDDSGSLVRSSSSERIRKATVIDPPPIEDLYDAHLKEYAEVSRSLESLKEACDDLIGGPIPDESPELVPKWRTNGEVECFIPKSLSLQSLTSIDESLESHSDSSLASSSSHSDTLQTGPAPLLDGAPENAFDDSTINADDHPSVSEDLKEIDSEVFSPTRGNLRSNSIDDVFTVDEISNDNHVILRQRQRSRRSSTTNPIIPRLTSLRNETEDNEQRPRLNSRAEKFRKSSYGPVRRRSRRKASLVLRLAQLGTKGQPFNPDDHLFKYKFVSLRYNSEYESQLELRALLDRRPRNTEAQNYKLSYQREA